MNERAWKTHTQNSTQTKTSKVLQLGNSRQKYLQSWSDFYLANAWRTWLGRTSWGVLVTFSELLLNTLYYKTQIYPWQLSPLLTRCPSHQAKDSSFLLLHASFPQRLVSAGATAWPQQQARGSQPRVLLILHYSKAEENPWRVRYGLGLPGILLP